MGQRRTILLHVDGKWLKAAWIDERGRELDESILGSSEADIANDQSILELLESRLGGHIGAPGLNIEIQAESTELYEMLSRNERIRPLLSRRVGQEFIREEFTGWQGDVGALEETPQTKGASDNGITAEEGDSNE